MVEGLEERSTGGNLGNEIVDKKGKLSVSSIDFVGLGSASGDARNFDAVAWKPEQTQGDNSDLYKPKVSSWGVFPRPNDISKTFGGGRVIRPGEVLETAEEKAAKEARTRRLVAAYKSKMGMNSDPKLRSECEKNMFPPLFAINRNGFEMLTE
ncbi:PREDICTED: cytochrome C oxidase subunit [Prunus dulcis]|uniref:PREDICTED: cytochrome C oxidase subunit n=1 Tax=Prunus dulcis TaxID=3755 RepID=A0A5E4FYA6_PRUDU|nr:PREDICTED: cytochrome C oxidase subunit [Prunus dulcis]